nr:GNAT family N-acetyltransferase [Allomuricauda sp.]
MILETVTPDTVGTYISVGIKSYRQHYLHLWPNQDASPYIATSFTSEIVEKELLDANMEHFLFRNENEVVGIVKLVKDKALDEQHSAEASLFVEKIYILKEFSGKGFGTKLLTLIVNYAKKLNKNLIWLDTMQKGPQLNFYLKNGFEKKKASRLKLEDAKEEEKAMWIMAKHI